MVRAAHLKTLVTVEGRDDPVLSELVRGVENNRARNLAEDMGLRWPVTSLDVERWKCDRRMR